MENKKIKNATATSYNGQEFDSKLEVTIYRCLCEMKDYVLDIEREPVITLLDGWVTTVPFYDGLGKPLSSGKVRGKTVGNKVRKWTYSPDFVIQWKPKGKKEPVTVYIEAKGMPNDVYPLKTKMFRYILESQSNTEFWVVKNKSQLLKLLKEE